MNFQALQQDDALVPAGSTSSEQGQLRYSPAPSTGHLIKNSQVDPLLVAIFCQSFSKMSQNHK